MPEGIYINFPRPYGRGIKHQAKASRSFKMEADKLTLNVSEAAIKLGVSRPSLYQGIKKGEIPVIRIGHRVLIPISALEKLLANAGAAAQ